MDPVFWRERAALVRREGYGSFIETVLTPRWFTPDFAERIAGSHRRLPRAFPARLARLRGLLRRHRDARPARADRRDQAPTLIMVGADDPATPVAMSEDLRSRIPDCRAGRSCRAWPTFSSSSGRTCVNPYLAAFLERDRVEITPQAGGASFEAGLANRKAVLGAEHVERSLAAAGDVRHALAGLHHPPGVGRDLGRPDAAVEDALVA